MIKYNRNEIIARDKGYVVLEDGTVNGPQRENIGRVHQGYHRFKIRVDGVNKNIMTHRLQALQKFGENIYKDNLVVRHLNGVSTDNSFGNIGIGSMSDNFMDIPRDERIRRAKHASTFVKKYDHEDVIDFYNECNSYKETMKEFGITSKGTLHFILKKNPKDYKEYDEL